MGNGTSIMSGSAALPSSKCATMFPPEEQPCTDVIAIVAASIASGVRRIGL